MATGDIALQGDFKERIRARLRETIMDLIPADSIDQMIEAEVKEFFHTEQLLSIKDGQIEIENPQYDTRRGTTWDNKPKISRDCMVINSMMTPFRQLVWSEVYNWLQPKVKEVLDNEKNTATAELNNWFGEQITPKLNVTYKTMFNGIATGMASTMMQTAVNTAVNAAHQTLLQTFSMAGMNTGNIPNPIIPQFRP